MGCIQLALSWCSSTAWINKVLEDEQRPAEWVLWMDIDTVVIDANFTLPFEEFAAKSKDLVVYGNKTEVRQGHPVKGTPLSSVVLPEVCLAWLVSLQQGMIWIFLPKTSPTGGICWSRRLAERS